MVIYSSRPLSAFGTLWNPELSNHRVDIHPEFHSGWEIMGCGCNTFRSRQNDCYFAEDISKLIFVNQNWCIFIPILQRLSQGSNWHYVSICLYNRLLSNKQQAIFWANDGLYLVIHIYQSASELGTVCMLASTMGWDGRTVLFKSWGWIKKQKVKKMRRL